MALDFPNSPTLNDIFTAGSKSWIWDGTAWSLRGVEGPTGPTGLTGPTGPTGLTGAAGADGADGVDGTDGTDGVDGKTVLNGTIDPTTEGVDGDFYINTASNEIFGPKTAGVWGSGTSIIGATGADGIFQISSGPPGSPSPGEIWFDSDDGYAYIYYDSAWIEIGTASGVGGGGGSGATVTVSASAPGSPVEGDLWFDTDTSILSIWYEAATPVWVEINSGGSGTFEDPAHLTTGDSTVTYALQYEFDDAADLAAATVVVPSGTSTEAIGNGVLSTISDDQSSVNLCAALWSHSLAIGDCVETAFSYWMIPSNYPMAGVLITNGNTSAADIQAAGLYNNGADPRTYLIGGTLNSTSEYSGSTNSSDNLFLTNMYRPMRVRITRVDADTWKAEYSDSGTLWTQLGRDMEWDDTMTPTHVGVYWSTFTGTFPTQFSFDYIRVYTP